MASSIAAYRTPNGAAAPRIRADIEDLAADVELTATPTFATTTAASAAYSAAIAAGKVGMSCYITNRAGVWRYVHRASGAKAWVWDPQINSVYEQHRGSAADSSGAVFVDILLMPSTALPPGNRRLQITASSNPVALANGGSYPVAQVAGPGIGGSEGNMISFSGFAGAPTQVSRQWSVIASGSVAYTLRGKDGHPTAPVAVRFTDSILQVLDLGPSDD